MKGEIKREGVECYEEVRRERNEKTWVYSMGFTILSEEFVLSGTTSKTRFE